MLGSKIPSWFGAARCSVPMSSSHRPTGASVAPPTPRAAWSGGRLCGGAGVCSAGGSTVASLESGLLSVSVPDAFAWVFPGRASIHDTAAVAPVQLTSSPPGARIVYCI